MFGCDTLWHSAASCSALRRLSVEALNTSVLTATGSPCHVPASRGHGQAHAVHHVTGPGIPLAHKQDERRGLKASQDMLKGEELRVTGYV